MQVLKSTNTLTVLLVNDCSSICALSKMRKLFVVVYPAVSVGKTVVGNHGKNKIIVTIYNELTNLLPLQ